MSETSQQIVSLIVSKEFNKAKNLITESMNEKLGLLLEEKLMEYAPTLFEAIETDGNKNDKSDTKFDYCGAACRKRNNEIAQRKRDLKDNKDNKDNKK